MKRPTKLSLLVIAVVAIAGGMNLFSSGRDLRAANPVRLTSLPPSVTTKGKLTSQNFEDSIQSLYASMKLSQHGLHYDVFRYGMIGYFSLSNQNKLSQRKLVSFIDFTKRSVEKRFWTVDLEKRRIVFHSLVSHGRNTGEDKATAFSNVPHSNQSSLGFYITGETYVGSKGYSLRLDGVDGKFNDKMRQRAVVMHSAAYVSDSWITKYGRLGRSQGCPALPNDISRKVIDTIKDQTLIFAYFNDGEYLASSNHLNVDELFQRLDLQDAVATTL